MRELVMTACANCGIQFALPLPFIEARRNDHFTFYCPNGHSLCIPILPRKESKAEQLQEMLTATQRELERLQKSFRRNRCPQCGRLTGKGGCPRHQANRVEEKP